MIQNDQLRLYFPHSDIYLGAPVRYKTITLKTFNTKKHWWLQKLNLQPLIHEVLSIRNLLLEPTFKTILNSPAVTIISLKSFSSSSRSFPSTSMFRSEFLVPVKLEPVVTVVASVVAVSTVVAAAVVVTSTVVAAVVVDSLSSVSSVTFKLKVKVIEYKQESYRRLKMNP